MEFMERIAASILFRNFLQEDGYEGAFEDFFHRLMQYRYPGFIPIRTAGQLGDMGADAVVIGRKLYASYAPRSYSAKNAKKKFWSDLNKGLQKHPDEFDTVVFVHNGIRGLHPLMVQEMEDARKVHSGLNFESMGPTALRRELLRLDREEVEDLLRAQIPVDMAQFQVGVEDLTDLLSHLMRASVPSDPSEIEEVPLLKIEFNLIDDQTKAEIRDAHKQTYMVEQYYLERRDVTERDAVALDLHREYEELRTAHEDPDDILWELEKYILGNASVPFKRRRAAIVVLASFFETCDIFEEPTEEWLRGRTVDIAN